jgi:mannose-6-phosphate isomerase-like protein (cupin superfamily)
MSLQEVDLDAPGDLATLLKSRFEATPPHRVDVKSFQYRDPELKPGKTRSLTRLATTDILFAAIQLFKSGGENVMHSHAGMDGFWMVLKGRARFYLKEGEPLEFGPLGGLCIPRGVKYWFESIGDVPLETLQVEAIHPQIRNIVELESEVSAESVEASIAFYEAQAGAAA